jgi:lysophospholipase L1-like esterase
MTMAVHTGDEPSSKTSYDFKRGFPSFFAALLFAAGLVIVLVAHFSDNAVSFSPLFMYGLIIMAAGAVAFLFSRFSFTAMAWGLIVLMSLDLGFGLMTHALAAMGLKNSFLPLNNVSLFAPKRFVYHPLLQAQPAPDYDDGFYAHDAKGRRKVVNADQARGPRIAVIGGSSTYDLGVKNGETWPDRLQERLTNATILNYGVPGYSTAEHIIQSAFYTKWDGISCAVYYVGWNDIRNSFIPDLDPGYARFHMLSQKDNQRIRLTASPLSIYNFIANSRYFSGYIPIKPDYRSYPPRSGIDEELAGIYQRNLANIKALNDAQGIKTLFVAQLLNYRKLTKAHRYGWFPLVNDKDVRPIQEHFNKLLKKSAKEHGAGFIEVPYEKFEDADFVDNGHFSASGAIKFANAITGAVRATCLGGSGPAGAKNK